MTADYIAFHALERPDAVALIDHGRSISYASFDRDLRRMTMAVAELGVPRGEIVAVGARLYTEWLLLLACEQLGIVTVSLASIEGPETTQLLAGVDLAMIEPHFPKVAARRQHTITPEWIAEALGREGGREPHCPPRSLEDPVRILRTSGTTGRPKRILHRRAQHEAWIARWIAMTGLSHRSRLLITISFVVNGMYACANACLRAGGTAVSTELTQIRHLEQAIAEHDITALVGGPRQSWQMVDALSAGFTKPENLTLCCFGAPVPDPVRRRVLERLATDLIDMYGCNEAGFIASRSGSREDGVSTIWPGVELEIVDDRDLPLPDGQSGRIRVRTPDMVQSYIDNAEATSRMFRGGWFYPGDLGIRQGPRGLRILGRGDELLNLGGLKMPPEPLEQAILKAVPMQDIGVCTGKNEQGIEELVVGIVGVPGGHREFIERISDALKPYRPGRFQVVQLQEIPRNANGKIRRDLLRAAVSNALRAARTP